MTDLGTYLINNERNSNIENFGKPYRFNASFDGVEKKRKVTDCFCLIFFFLFLCGMAALFIVALGQSNYKYVYIPHDSRGLLCGYDNKKLKVDNSKDLPDLSDLKYLFWIRPGKPGFSRSFCVKECPSVGYFSDAYLSLDSNLNGFSKKNSSICGEFEGKTVFPSIENYSSTKDKRFYCPYSTSVIIGRCFPTNKAFQNIVDSVNKSEAAKVFGTSFQAASYAIRAVSDIYRTYFTIFICVLASLVLSFLWIISLRCCAGFFVWLAVLLSLASMGVLTWMCYAQWKNDFKNHQLIEKYTFGFVSEQLNRKIFMIFFIALSVFDGIFFLMVIFLFDKIKSSIKIIEYVSKIFAKIPSLFFFPIVQYLILVVWWAYIIIAAFVLFGAGHFERKIDSDVSGPPIDRVEMKYDKLIQGFAIYHFFGFLWVSFFIISLGEMTVAGTIANFFFTKDRKNFPRCSVTRSFFRSLSYHTGTLAFGSLIITIFKVIRLIFEYIDQKTKNSKSNFATCVVKCCKCCLWCFEKFLRYLNRNAYIMTSIHGYNFCKGAKKAFELIMRNLSHIVTLNWVGDFTLFLGKIFVSFGVTSFALYLFKSNNQVQFYVVPTVITFLMCYLAMGTFTSIYELGIDSVVICFMEDKERSGGILTRSVSSKELTKIIGKEENDNEIQINNFL